MPQKVKTRMLRCYFRSRLIGLKAEAYQIGAQGMDQSPILQFLQPNDSTRSCLVLRLAESMGTSRCRDQLKIEVYSIRERIAAEESSLSQ